MTLTSHLPSKRDRPSHHKLRTSAVGHQLLPAADLAHVSAIYADRLDSSRATLPLALSLLIAGVNFHLSFIRPSLHKRRTGSSDGYKRVSGIPVLGTMLAVLGLAIRFGATVPSYLAGVSTIPDTGGLLCHLFALWRDGSLWDD